MPAWGGGTGTGRRPTTTTTTATTATTTTWPPGAPTSTPTSIGRGRGLRRRRSSRSSPTPRFRSPLCIRIPMPATAAALATVLLIAMAMTMMPRSASASASSATAAKTGRRTLTRMGISYNRRGGAPTPAATATTAAAFVSLGGGDDGRSRSGLGDAAFGSIGRRRLGTADVAAPRGPGGIAPIFRRGRLAGSIAGGFGPPGGAFPGGRGSVGTTAAAAHESSSSLAREESGRAPPLPRVDGDDDRRGGASGMGEIDGAATTAPEMRGGGGVSEVADGKGAAEVREARGRLDQWRSNPNLEGLALQVCLPTIVVPASSVHTLMSSRILREYMPLKRLEGIHPRVKMVRDFDSVAAAAAGGGGGGCGEGDGEGGETTTEKKILLLDPDAVCADAADAGRTPAASNATDDIEGSDDAAAARRVVPLRGAFPGLSPEALTLVSEAGASVPNNPQNLTLTLGYDRLPLSTVLETILPPGAHPPPVSFEIVGHVAHFNLRERHVPYGEVIGTVVLDKLSHTSGGIRTVVNKVGEVGGMYRTYQMELLAGEPDYDVTVVEDGTVLKFDVRGVYWCTRLGGERSRLLGEEFGEGQVVADAFCGVGAVCVRAARGLGCTVLANDWNPDAVDSCRENARLNGIEIAPVDDGGGDGVNGGGGERFYVRCGDARDFIRSLGMGGSGGGGGGGGSGRNGQATGNRPKKRTGRWERRRRRQRPPSSSSADDAPSSQSVSRRRRHQLPHHLLLNHPSDAPSFLDQLRWWPPPGEEGGGDVVTTVHVYTFARADDVGRDDDEDADGHDDDGDCRRRTASEAAVDLVASNLLPEGGASEPRRFRRDDLDGLGCEVRVREVRDVAPGKVVLCVSFRATGALIRHMQGDYVDVV